MYQTMAGHDDDIAEIDAQIANAFLTEGAASDALEIFETLAAKLEGKDKQKEKKAAVKKKPKKKIRKRLNLDDYDDDPADPNLANVVNGMGTAYRQQGEYDNAIVSYTRALNIYIKSLGVFDSKFALRLFS
jgi:tetratricopeptide (TPR) repeat protein